MHTPHVPLHLRLVFALAQFFLLFGDLDLLVHFFFRHLSSHDRWASHLLQVLRHFRDQWGERHLLAHFLALPPA